MSYSLDANVLLYASDSSNKHFSKAAKFLSDCARSRDILYVAWPTLMAYVRISTHQRVFATPLSHADATKNVSNLLALPNVRVLSETDTFWETYLELTATDPIKGNLVPDAHLAALLKSNAITTLYSADRDFRRFPFLDVRNPFE